MGTPAAYGPQASLQAESPLARRGRGILAKCCASRRTAGTSEELGSVRAAATGSWCGWRRPVSAWGASSGTKPALRRQREGGGHRTRRKRASRVRGEALGGTVGAALLAVRCPVRRRGCTREAPRGSLFGRTTGGTSGGRGGVWCGELVDVAPTGRGSDPTGSAACRAVPVGDGSWPAWDAGTSSARGGGVG